MSDRHGEAKDSSISVAYPASADRVAIAEFRDALEAEGVEVREHVVPDGMEYRAAIEWLVPTLVVLYVSKAYFDGFLKAVAADHYGSLKRAATKLISWAAELRPMKVTARTIEPAPGPYSPAISVVFSNGLETYKLLFPVSGDQAAIGKAISLFLQFCEAVSKGDDASGIAALVEVRFPGTPRLLVLDDTQRGLKEIDPLEGRRT